MALGSTQPLVKMSTRNIPRGKGGRCVRLKTSPTSRAERHEIWEPKSPGTLWVTPGLLRDCFTFIYIYIFQSDELSVTCYCGWSRRSCQPCYRIINNPATCSLWNTPRNKGPHWRRLLVFRQLESSGIGIRITEFYFADGWFVWIFEPRHTNTYVQGKSISVGRGPKKDGTR